jgi:hypothetical protein
MNGKSKPGYLGSRSTAKVHTLAGLAGNGHVYFRLDFFNWRNANEFEQV